MNLTDCGVRFIRLPDGILQLHRKVELIQTINLYRLYDPDRRVRIAVREVAGTDSPIPETPYQRRQRAETLMALERARILRQSDKAGTLELVPIPATAEGRILIPFEFEYGNLSAVAIKTLLACHQSTRYRRTADAFRFTIMQEELAKTAGISVRRLADALGELEKHHLLETWSHKQRRHYLKEQKGKIAVPAKKRSKPFEPGVTITLKEPNSDTPLFFLGQWHMKQVEQLTSMERYKLLLENYDPKGGLADIRGDATVRGYHVSCPLCSKEKVFTFTCTEDEDVWHCFNCLRSGNSRTLWAKLNTWKYRTSWRRIIPAIINQDSSEIVEPGMDSDGWHSFAELEKELATFNSSMVEQPINEVKSIGNPPDWGYPKLSSTGDQ